MLEDPAELEDAGADEIGLTQDEIDEQLGDVEPPGVK
jgi:hypothetical protein